MAKILIIDNNIDPPYGCEEIRLLLQQNAATSAELRIESVRAPDGLIPTSCEGWNAVVLSGSKTRIFENAPWVEREMNFLRSLHQAKVPTLGICYGEQLMVRVFAGDAATGVSKIPEFGWTEIEALPAARESKIFSGLPKKFYSFSFHADEVYSELPDTFRVVMKSELCPVQAFELLDAPMWGIQFHPERGFLEGNRSLDRRKQSEPSTEVLNRDMDAANYSEQIAKEIFSGFLKEVFKGHR